MKLRLVKLSQHYRRHLTEMLDEWYAAGEKIIPYAIRRLDYRDFDSYLAGLEITAPKEGLVPDSTFFCLDEDADTFVGAVNIRHCLNAQLLVDGGHIGDGVRPSARGKGAGTQMVALALEECRKLGLSRVLMVCDKDNTASAKTIRRNGGVLENELTVDGAVQQRYWIDLRSSHRFFQNTACRYFPCHPTNDPENFSCLFCYCPLYALGDRCGGCFVYTDTGIKDCSACLRPHREENYDAILDAMGKILELAKKPASATENS